MAGGEKKRVSEIERERASRVVAEQQAKASSQGVDSASSSNQEAGENEKNPAISNPRWEDTKGQAITKALVGNHCHNGCDLKDDIDKKNNKWNDNAREKSTCVMFGSANGKESFCSECATQVRKVDLSEGVY